MPKTATPAASQQTVATLTAAFNNINPLEGKICKRSKKIRGKPFSDEIGLSVTVLTTLLYNVGRQNAHLL